MKIFFRKKEIADINCVSDLENFIISKSLYKYFKKIPDNFITQTQNKINNTGNINFKELKPWLRNLLNYPDSIYNPNFLKSMGWNINEIKEFIEKKQKINSSILRDKKKNNPELYYDSTTSRIEYWVKKGYSIEESRQKVSERQKTFSKDLCIKKFGYIKGVEIFEERQKKWINTLKSKNNYSDIQSTKNSYKYSDNNYINLINRTSFIKNTKDIIIKNLDSLNIETFVDNVLKDVDVKRYSDIQPYICSSIIQKKFNKSKDEIKHLFYSKTFYTLSNQTYGIPIYHNNKRFKSIKEYEIALFLEKNLIDYIYEKNYPISKQKFDFYIPVLDLYIEYFGMIDNKNYDKLDEIQKKYKEKMEEKILFCEKNKLKLIYDTNYVKLIEKIKKHL